MTPMQQDLIREQIASQAEFVVDNLQQTDYQHTDNIDVDNGVYDCDCNGFVGFVLKNVAPSMHWFQKKPISRDPAPSNITGSSLRLPLNHRGHGAESIHCGTLVGATSSRGDSQESRRTRIPVMFSL
jgi:hypothetical protein